MTCYYFCLTEFALDPKLKEYIQTAKTDFAKQCSALDVDHLEYLTYNKKFIKDQKLSPDSILQLVIQVRTSELFFFVTLPFYDTHTKKEKQKR